MGIEPTSKAWEAYDISQKHAGLAAFLQFSERLNWKIMENGKRLSLLMNPKHEPFCRNRSLWVSLWVRRWVCG